jgi:ferredoxin-NADP reductase
MPFEAGLIAVRIAAMRYGAVDIVFLDLEPLEAAPLPGTEPGAHVDLHFGDGLVRQYSVVTPLSDGGRYVVAVKRDASGRGGSRWLHDHARAGQVLRMSPPRANFGLVQADRPTLLLAGGIGITPIYSMFEHLEASGRPVELHYWCRSAEHQVFRKALHGRRTVHLHYSTDGTDGVRPFGMAQALAAAPADADIYGCGPARMLDELKDIAAGRELHLERFAPASLAPSDGEDFTVELARSGGSFRVLKGQTILEVLLHEGVDVVYSCEQGVCGACEVKVLEGRPIHADSVDSPAGHERRKTMMICCSTSASERLVLDI